eukprot:1921689-Prymnesium_polylepis.2
MPRNARTYADGLLAHTPTRGKFLIEKMVVVPARVRVEHLSVARCDVRPAVIRRQRSAVAHVTPQPHDPRVPQPSGAFTADDQADAGRVRRERVERVRSAPQRHA